MDRLLNLINLETGISIIDITLMGSACLVSTMPPGESPRFDFGGLPGSDFYVSTFLLALVSSKRLQESCLI